MKKLFLTLLLLVIARPVQAQIFLNGFSTPGFGFSPFGFTTGFNPLSFGGFGPNGLNPYLGNNYNTYVDPLQEKLYYSQMKGRIARSQLDSARAFWEKRDFYKQKMKEQQEKYGYIASQKKRMETGRQLYDLKLMEQDYISRGYIKPRPEASIGFNSKRYKNLDELFQSQDYQVAKAVHDLLEIEKRIQNNKIKEYVWRESAKRNHMSIFDAHIYSERTMLHRNVGILKTEKYYAPRYTNYGEQPKQKGKFVPRYPQS